MSCQSFREGASALLCIAGGQGFTGSDAAGNFIFVLKSAFFNGKNSENPLK